jgi:hypothetical protein
MAKGQGLRAKGKKDTARGLPEVALPSLSPQPLALSLSVPPVVSCSRKLCRTHRIVTHINFHGMNG